MRCEEFRKEAARQFGGAELGLSARDHLAGCPRCSAYYEELLALERAAQSTEKPLMTASEFAAMQMKLDNEIVSYRSRANRFFRFAVRYGVVAGAAALLLLLVYFGRLPGNYGISNPDKASTRLSVDSAISEIFASMNTGEETLDTTEIQPVDDPYVNMVIGNYTESYGIGADEALLGGLSDEEMNYLKNKLKAGDIL
ncbi:hypothetical protein TRIP_C60563 [Candidatus Zixiibacteriota bacterium]|nr:hypothetical protein TRIP_C60563 [candidate division Zixibacteria bacterium]